MKTKTILSLTMAAALLALAANGQTNGLSGTRHSTGRSMLRSQLNNRIARSRSVERADWTVRERGLRSTAATSIDPKTTAATQAALAVYPHYRLIDLGTLGGDNAFGQAPVTPLAIPPHAPGATLGGPSYTDVGLAPDAYNPFNPFEQIISGNSGCPADGIRQSRVRSSHRLVLYHAGFGG